MTRVGRWASALLLVVGLPTLAEAQVVQSVQFGAGWFMPKGMESRAIGDVLVANLSQGDVLPGVSGSLVFDIKDFRAWTLFGEWNIAFGNRIEASVGVGYYQQTVHSRYKDLVNSEQNNADIEQDLKLRQTPISGLVRFMPFGKPGSVQPYLGGGIAVVNFRYSESGEFVDPFDFTIFPETYVATGTAVGPVILGGVRLPINGDIYAFTMEGRYQWVEGKTGGALNGFLGDKIDLGGGTINFGLLIRF